ncbi:MAG: T9SS type A sorting domain-containing protein, partial [Saprospiraceae bacterium]|nr:T9SS type A sorting domain-containing protein [Saprospiraceae bacterium]
LAPVCLITGPVEDGGTIEAAGCNYDFFAELDVMDECGTIDYSYQIFNGETVTHQGFGQLESFITNHVTIAAGNLSDGSYVLRVRTTDQCQNEGFCNYTFDVVTGKKPSPVCLSSITVELTPEDVDNDGSLDTAMALIWAEEFDVSSSAPCGVSDADLQFYIERINGDSDFETLDTTVDEKFLSLGCDDVGTQMVRMWVLSPTGSSDFCDVYLMVQANSGGCPTSVPVFSNVEGSILTSDGVGVKDVTVNGALLEMTIESPSTDANGSYDMMFGLGEKVSITPAKDGDDVNGVNTSDLLLLANHISNASPISSPYLRIAGDVNFDGIINAFDILLMRDVILKNVPALPDGDSWRFVPTDYSFTSSFPESEDFPESVEMELDQENMRADFVAMKIGDLDLDRNTQLAGRSAEPMLMQIDDTPFKMGDKVEIRPYLPEEAVLLGMQFEIHFDPEALEFVGLKFEGELPVRDENFGLKYTEEGIIYFSWNEQRPLLINREKLIFGFDFTAKSNGRPSESISLTGQRLSATGYPEIGVSRPIALRFNGSDAQIQVGQNMPNPFRQTTVIPIILADSDIFTLVVTDLSGKIVLKRRISGIAGKQEIEIASGELNAPGVYYYTIIDNNSTITNKMILLR